MPNVEFNPHAYGAWVKRRNAEKEAERNSEIAGWQEAKRQGLVGDLRLPQVPVLDLTPRKARVLSSSTR